MTGPSRRTISAVVAPPASTSAAWPARIQFSQRSATSSSGNATSTVYRIADMANASREFDAIFVYFGSGLRKRRKKNVQLVVRHGFEPPIGHRRQPDRAHRA